MRADLAQILTELSVAERRELEVKLEYDRNSKGADKYGFEDERWWSAACTILSRHNYMVPLVSLDGYVRRERIGMATYKQAVVAHHEVFVMGGIDFEQGTAIQQTFMFGMSIGAVYFWLRSQGYPVSMEQLIRRSLDCVKTAFESQYPGCIENKLLPKIYGIQTIRQSR